MRAVTYFKQNLLLLLLFNFKQFSSGQELRVTSHWLPAVTYQCVLRGGRGF